MMMDQIETAQGFRDQPSQSQLNHVPPSMRIRILYQDRDIVVVHKPPNLRSVPGHANREADNEQGEPERKDSTKKRKRCGLEPNLAENLEPRTAQEAWILAIQSFASSDSATAAENYLHRLACSSMEGTGGRLASIPRKYPLFCRYLKRSKERLFGIEKKKDPRAHSIDDVATNSDPLNDALLTSMFQQIQERQRSFMNVPTPTAHEESAVGQLQLLGFGGNAPSEQLYVVHRLDCATSGVMVVARTSSAASALSAAWRARSQVHKTYLTMVHAWPSAVAESSALRPDADCDVLDAPLKPAAAAGRIDLPLMPSTNERLKWVVDHEHGKPSTTMWKVLSDQDARYSRTCAKSPRFLPPQKPVLLELQPVTGRTHQLRIHCAEFAGTKCGGIVGDTLYGSDSVQQSCSSGSNSTAPLPPPSLPSMDIHNNRLYLHAYKLSFPHPSTLETMEFVDDPAW
jgi:23S rRNA-/tRNA-specific pseudouridylate synthase